MVQYKILFSESMLKDIKQYKDDIINNKIKPGAYLQKHIDSLDGSELNNITTENFVELLLWTKKPKIFATSSGRGDGTDWNQLEFKFLGDISLSMDVEVYDNGIWSVTDEGFLVHDRPFHANLIFSNGPLFTQGPKGRVLPDFEEVKSNNGIDAEKYNALIERRLLPAFSYANLDAGQQKKRALVVLPGLGCGVFAGRFKGQMGEYLNKALKFILEKHGDKLPNILCIWYDPYNECKNSEIKIHNIDYRVRLGSSPLGKPQLSKIQDFEESIDEFKDCVLYKIVAWDHLAFPGNGYFIGKRFTDDGMVGAATNCMEVVTDVKGVYKEGYYLTPSGDKMWINIAEKLNCKLVAKNNVFVSLFDGKCVELNKLERCDDVV